MRRTTAIFGALVLLAMYAGTARADVRDVTGTVSHVTREGNLVTLQDGRIVKVKPGSVFSVNGQRVTIDQIRPGTRFSAAPAAVESVSGTSVRTVSGHPPIDASGTIASYDAQRDIVTFQDGRMLKLGGETTLWREAQRQALRPGEQILLEDAQPVGFRTAWDATSTPNHRMGSVMRVDPANALVILTDGTVVHVLPASRVQMNGQSMTLSQLQPGDELVIIGTPRHVTGASEAGGMAMPKAAMGAAQPFSTATFDATDVQLMRRHQAP